MANKRSFIQDYSVDVRKTDAVFIPAHATKVGVMIPDLTAGDITIEVYESGTTAIADITSASLLASADTDWNPVLDQDDGDDVVICANGKDPGFVDITEYVGALKEQYIRFVVAGDQDSDTTWWLYFS